MRWLTVGFPTWGTCHSPSFQLSLLQRLTDLFERCQGNAPRTDGKSWQISVCWVGHLGYPWFGLAESPCCSELSCVKALLIQTIQNIEYNHTCFLLCCHCDCEWLPLFIRTSCLPVLTRIRCVMVETWGVFPRKGTVWLSSLHSHRDKGWLINGYTSRILTNPQDIPMMYPW